MAFINQARSTGRIHFIRRYYCKNKWWSSEFGNSPPCLREHVKPSVPRFISLRSCRAAVPLTKRVRNRPSLDLTSDLHLGIKYLLRTWLNLRRDEWSFVVWPGEHCYQVQTNYIYIYIAKCFLSISYDVELNKML